MLKINFEGESLLIHEDQLGGYQGCEVLGEALDEDIADCPFSMVGRNHLNSVHIQKALEATFILSGYELTAGLLAEEARALGISLQELAQTVRNHRVPEREFEVERRVRKHNK